MDSTIKFTKEDVQEYLDGAITKWRIRKEDAIKAGGDEKHPSGNLLIAMCYIDAFQSMRISLFGEVLPAEGQKENT